MTDMPVLVCTGGSQKGQIVRVPEGGLTLGRAPDNNIVIDGEGVSRYHAQLRYDGGSLWLRDAGSRNGIFVNGNRVTDYKALKAGDVVTFADHTYAVRWESEVEEGSEFPIDEETQDGSPDGEGGESRKPWYWPF